MTLPSEPDIPLGSKDRRAATFELLFDLVFAFAITQVTQLIEAMRGVADAISTLSILLFLWWMYGGFVWLASHVNDGRKLAVSMLVSMIAFFILATGIPGLHGDDTMLVGIAAVIVVVIHFLSFVFLAGVQYSWTMLRIGAINLTAALLLLVGGFLPPGWAGASQLALIFLLVGMALVYAAEPFSLVPSHFVERHGLLLIIVFGESIISIGSGIPTQAPFAMLVDAVITLGLVIALWLAYFLRDDRLAEGVMRATPERKRGRIALLGYWAAFAVMIAGALVFAAGAKLHFSAVGVAYPVRFNDWIAAGLVLYLGGSGAFRAVMGLPGVGGRLLTSVIASAIAAIPSRMGAAVPLLAAFFLVSANLLIEELTARTAETPSSTM